MMFYRTLTLLKGFVEQRRIYSLSAEVETEQICTNKKANVGVRLKSGDRKRWLNCFVDFFTLTV